MPEDFKMVDGKAKTIKPFKNKDRIKQVINKCPFGAVKYEQEGEKGDLNG